MDSDLFFVVGIVVLGFAIPAIIGAFSEGRPPRAAAIMVMIGGGLIALALWQRPHAYTIAGIPDVFVRVVGQYVR
ncbi:MAG: hypothetical protein IT542_08510 [Rubellimicrobium sp.]|nr:hypothetical protein [Rubellimicrobium sp.]